MVFNVYGNSTSFNETNGLGQFILFHTKPNFLPKRHQTSLFWHSNFEALHGIISTIKMKIAI
jgi:hypothetical protein